MKEQLETLSINSFMSYKQLVRLLVESGKITDRDIQVLENLSREFFRLINNCVQLFPEEKNEKIVENKTTCDIIKTEEK